MTHPHGAKMRALLGRASLKFSAVRGRASGAARIAAIAAVRIAAIAAARIAAIAAAGIAAIAPAGDGSTVVAAARGRPGNRPALVAAAGAGAARVAVRRTADGAARRAVRTARIAAGILYKAREDHAAEAAGVAGITHSLCLHKKMSRSISLHDILCRILPGCYDLMPPFVAFACSTPGRWAAPGRGSRAASAPVPVFSSKITSQIACEGIDFFIPGSAPRSPETAP